MMLIVGLILVLIGSVEPCSPRDFGQGSVVCVCNATYCDFVEPASPLRPGNFLLYKSNKNGDRLKKSQGVFFQNPSNTTQYVIHVNKNVTYQTVIGFGGAFTDAAGINIASLSPKTQDNLINAYFAPNGIEYNVGRVPMASCDFSTRPYSYDDKEGDFNLTQFSLAQEDIKYKIPYIQKAMNVSYKKILMFGSPWSAPAWMKTDHNMTSNGTLIGQPGGKYYETWAKYFVKFLDAYASHNISFWGLTAQNEPTDGNIPRFKFQSMGWYPEQQRDFIVKDLGPALERSGHKDVKLMILDDQRILLPYWADKVLSSSEASKYISGIAVHWYLDKISPTECLDLTHKNHPDKFIFGTEACYDGILSEKVALGDWTRADGYAHDIIQDLNHWVTGWTDWNIALNMEGGPNWVKNYVDSPIIVNADKDEFYKQPMFYTMGHFSKFIQPDAVRVSLELKESTKDLEVVGFLNPDQSIVVVILNRSSNKVAISIKDDWIGYISGDLDPYSINTYIYWTLPPVVEE